jgi:threonine dehydratase
MALSIAEIKDAAVAIAGQVKRTPSIDAPRLADPGRRRVVLKLEPAIHHGSFKDRGAL